MIDAEMKNKVPKHENKEDVLTSNVFGLLELIDYNHLLEILGNAKSEGKNAKDRFENGKIKPLELELWRRFGNSEPDVFVTLDNGVSFVIEVKYFGGEHNSKEKIDSEDEEYIEKGQLKKYLEATNTDFIIYLTASYLSMKELSKDSRSVSNQIYHIHWKDFNKYLKLHGSSSSNECEKKVISKITEYLDYKGFEPWEGFKYREIYDIGSIEIGGFYGRK